MRPPPSRSCPRMRSSRSGPAVTAAPYPCLRALLRPGCSSIQVAVRSVEEMIMRRTFATFGLLAALGGAACGSPDDPAGADSAGADDRVQIVTTVAPLTSIVANVVGDHARIT